LALSVDGAKVIHIRRCEQGRSQSRMASRRGGGETAGETLRLLSGQAPSLTRFCKFVQAQLVADSCGAENDSEGEVGEALSRLYYGRN
jgi:hypothetical protein